MGKRRPLPANEREWLCQARRLALSIHRLSRSSSNPTLRSCDSTVPDLKCSCVIFYHFVSALAWHRPRKPSLPSNPFSPVNAPWIINMFPYELLDFYFSPSYYALFQQIRYITYQTATLINHILRTVHWMPCCPHPALFYGANWCVSGL